MIGVLIHDMIFCTLIYCSTTDVSWGILILALSEIFNIGNDDLRGYQALPHQQVQPRHLLWLDEPMRLSRPSFANSKWVNHHFGLPLSKNGLLG